ncbi:hypothetical protein, partial [Arenimonas composti]|uniref:hypothetical protein n=1 Tax=Arenimonas composti TaxID=370776 RepID=UPI001B7FD95B
PGAPDDASEPAEENQPSPERWPKLVSGQRERTPSEAFHRRLDACRAKSCSALVNSPEARTPGEATKPQIATNAQVVCS